MSRVLMAALAAGFVLSASSAQARSVFVMEAANGRSITLYKGDTLIIRLPVKDASGYVWHLIPEQDGPLQFYGTSNLTVDDAYVRGMGGKDFHFKVRQSASFGRSGYLKFVLLRPSAPGIKDGRLWKVKYSISSNLVAFKSH